MRYKLDGKSKRFLKPLVRYFAHKRIAAIKPGDILAAAKQIYPKASPATWNRQAVVPARAVINHCAERGMCSHVRVKLFRESPAVKRAVDWVWVTKFVEAASNPRIGALELFMFTTAARISQALALDWQADIDLQEGTAKIPAAKGFPERLAYLTPEMVVMLANLPGEKKGLVFGYVYRWSVYKLWRETCKNAEIPYIPPHQSGRHSFFTETIARNKIDPKTAASLGGSASPALLFKTYVHPEKQRSVINTVFGTKQSHSGENLSTETPKNARKQ